MIKSNCYQGNQIYHTKSIDGVTFCKFLSCRKDLSSCVLKIISVPYTLIDFKKERYWCLNELLTPIVNEFIRYNRENIGIQL